MKLVFVLCAVAAVVTAIRWMVAQEEATRKAYDNDGK